MQAHDRIMHESIYKIGHGRLWTQEEKVFFIHPQPGDFTEAKPEGIEEASTNIFLTSYSWINKPDNK